MTVLSSNLTSSENMAALLVVKFETKMKFLTLETEAFNPNMKFNPKLHDFVKNA